MYQIRTTLKNSFSNRISLVVSKVKKRHKTLHHQQFGLDAINRRVLISNGFKSKSKPRSYYSRSPSSYKKSLHNNDQKGRYVIYGQPLNIIYTGVSVSELCGQDPDRDLLYEQVYLNVWIPGPSHVRIPRPSRYWSESVIRPKCCLV